MSIALDLGSNTECAAIVAVVHLLVHLVLVEFLFL